MSYIHYPFPSIQQFVNVKRNIQYYTQIIGVDENGDAIFNPTIPLPKVAYEATIKLHGTNSGLVLIKTESGVDFYCQSREQIITTEKDNAGFANYIATLSSEDFDVIAANFPNDWEIVVIYGEWAGRGVQKGVAISELPKAFYPFAARIIDQNNLEKEDWLNIRDWIFPPNIHNIYKFPTSKVDINFSQPELDIDNINKQVLSVEEECPVGKFFGISSIGEGIVLMPVDRNYNNSKFWFKAKGSKHSNSNVKKLATVDVEKFKTKQEFIKNVLDEERLQQGCRWLLDNGKELDQKSTGDFIRWVLADVVKEKKLEMEASEIKEKDLGKLLAPACKQWFFSKISTI